MLRHFYDSNFLDQIASLRAYRQVFRQKVIIRLNYYSIIILVILYLCITTAHIYNYYERNLTLRGQNLTSIYA